MQFKVISAGEYTLEAPRVELIDTHTNKVFADCVSVRDIELAYEGFWNNTVDNPREKVKVLGVEKV